MVGTEGASPATCGTGQGLHLSEDLVTIEAVDAAGRAVPAGVLSDKVYLTNLLQPGPSADPLMSHAAGRIG